MRFRHGGVDERDDLVEVLVGLGEELAGVVGELVPVGGVGVGEFVLGCGEGQGGALGQVAAVGEGEHRGDPGLAGGGAGEAQHGDGQRPAVAHEVLGVLAHGLDGGSVGPGDPPGAVAGSSGWVVPADPQPGVHFGVEVVGEVGRGAGSAAHAAPPVS
jgi:hypothetical protein